MQKIVTLTLNPAIDKSTSVASVIPDKKLRCALPKFEPGGGGVNVSRALKRLGVSSTAIYLAGSYSGKHFQHLLDGEGIESNVIEIAGHTRENLIVMDNAANLQYRFGMPGPLVNEGEWMKSLELFDREKALDYIIASGSLPGGVPSDYYARIAQKAKNMGARLVIDSSGEALKEALEIGVFMIKPNLGELSQLLGVEEIHEQEAIGASRQIIDKGGSEVVVVSMGASGAILVTKEDVFHSSSPAVKRKSTVGAGDSMVAGMVKALSQQWHWKDVLHYGIATGTATTMNPGTELCRIDDVEKLYAKLKNGLL